MSEKFDKLVAEAKKAACDVYKLAEYDDGRLESAVIHPGNAVNNVYSVTKSFTSAAMGLLFDRGALKPEDSVYKFFSSRGDCGEIWKEITVADMLSQTTGIAHGFLDIDCEDAERYPTDDYLSMVLGAEIVHKPGTVMTYSDSNYYLASRIVTEASGVECGELLEREIFRPLSFVSHAYARCPMGYMMGATGLFLRVEDMLKFGILLLDGCYNGKRLLSEVWLKNAARDHTNNHYGWGFWLGEGDVFRCGGMLSQIINVEPSRRRVIAWAACDRCGGTNEMQKIL